MRILGILLLLLALVLFTMLHAPDRPAAGRAPGLSAPEVWTAPGRPAPDSGHLAVIAQRPLFQPQRRPPAPAEVEDPVPDPPRVRLSAVSISSDVRVAVIKDLDSGRTQRVREGEMLNLWTIKHVHPRQIVLQWNDRETIIPLFSGE